MATKKSASKQTGSRRTDPGDVKCGKWEAIHDFQPPGPARLRVTGVCRTPTPGWRIRLEEAEPQGINPLNLILIKIVTPPKRPKLQIGTMVDVRFTKRTKTRYTSVTIMPDGKTIKVQDVE